MKSIRNIKIKTKLLLLGVISIGGLILMGTESVLTARQINQASTDISQEWLPSVIIAEELNTATSDYRLNENYHVIAKDETAMKEAEAELTTLRRKIEDGFKTYNSYVTSEEDAAMMTEARNLWTQYLECSDRLLIISRDNRTEEALDLIQNESRELFDQSSALFLKVAEFNKQGAEEASILGDHLYARLTAVKAVSILLIGLFIVGMVIYLIRAIEKPVEALVEGTRKVSNGDLDVHLEYDSEDEIGMLTKSVNTLIHRLNNIIKDERHLLHEIGNENYHAQSQCQQAYRGDFAPLLYAITSLQSRLEESSLNKKTPKNKTKNQAVIERIEIKNRKNGIT